MVLYCSLQASFFLRNRLNRAFSLSKMSFPAHSCLTLQISAVENPYAISNLHTSYLEWLSSSSSKKALFLLISSLFTGCGENQLIFKISNQPYMESNTCPDNSSLSHEARGLAAFPFDMYNYKCQHKS